MSAKASQPITTDDPEFMTALADVRSWPLRSLVISHDGPVGLLAVAEFEGPGEAIYTGVHSPDMKYRHCDLYAQCAAAVARSIVRFNRKGQTS